VTRDEEIAAALEHFGIAMKCLELISPLGERKGERFSYRVDAEGGRTFKLRILDSPQRARFLLEVRALLEDAFAPALACCGRILLEEWIEGTRLSAKDEERRAGEAGALLGRLHSISLPPHLGVAMRPRDWLGAAQADLELLAGAGLLAPGEVAAMRAKIARSHVSDALPVLVHQDLCAENMLIDTGGVLRVIDNEQLAFEPAGFDVARSLDRWSMSPAAQERFLAGYRSAAAIPASLHAWQIVATLLGARVRLQRNPARLPATLERLRVLLHATREVAAVARTAAAGGQGGAAQ
jgi:Ser/Thr protein kinase RdoA (MazF antagonist)